MMLFRILDKCSLPAEEMAIPLGPPDINNLIAAPAF